ncbi:DUF368 domain-containing protein [Sedimentibacter sp. zth1]|uniref:DUF368 domain-containing protein n=1 Tax=Sedimentibacter sp. zth1 TaxID=2816908 RepID=UPI001A920648|nr:DUF368 domain-containing protein [Sedimentibacter sp. zth1]QSX04703.1 DUF368 domain-containing protein [Sedimentibacter sp. zth1]
MLSDMIKGLIIGVSMLIPGVSGGTVAIIFGIYYKLIIAVDTFLEDPKKNIKILASVAIGGVIGVLAFSKPVLLIYNTYKIPMLYLFMGAVLGSVPLLFKSAGIKKVKPKMFVYPIIGLLCVILVEQIPKDMFSVETEGLLGYAILFLVSIFLAIPLILPGISFSYMLLILGLYEPTLMAIHTLQIQFLLPMCLGIIIGIFITAKIIRFVLKKYPLQTYLVIIGFVLASLKYIYPGTSTGNELLISILSLLVGFFIIYKFSENKN